MLWLKGLTRQDEMIEDVERVSYIAGTEDVLIRLWDKREIKYGNVNKVLIIDE